MTFTVLSIHNSQCDSFNIGLIILLVTAASETHMINLDIDLQVSLKFSIFTQLLGPVGEIP